MFGFALLLAISGIIQTQALVLPLRTRNNGGGASIVSDDYISKTLLFQLGASYYLAPTKPELALASFGSSGLASGAAPVAYFTSNASYISVDTMKAMIDTYTTDDVFVLDFMSRMTTFPHTSHEWAPRPSSWAKEYPLQAEALPTIHASGLSAPLAGPYKMIVAESTAAIYPVYLLKHDKYRDFIFGAYPGAEGTGYIPFDHVTTEFGDPWIPLPSKLYPSSGPLAGLRMVVKDIYDVQGLQTAAGSRVYAELYPTANASASSVQRLLDLGAVIVGKTKTAQFASGASTNDVTLEVQYPFSPRADGWQSCGASSSGSGCAVAAYDWVDFGLGTDTGGSVRVPAAMSGLYGNRPSVGAIELDGVVPIASIVDTAGILARDPYLWSKIAKLWYAESPLDFKSYASFPKRVIYPTDYLPHGTPEGQAIVADFIGKLQAQFGMERLDRNFTADLIVGGQNVSELNRVTAVINRWSQWVNVGQDLVTRYEALNGGRYPPLEPNRRGGFRLARANLTQAMADQAVPVLTGFREWFNNDFLPYNAETCSDIMVYDIGFGGFPSYREAALNNGLTAFDAFADPRGNALTQSSISPVAGCVDITIPIGQSIYNSTVTFFPEMRPVTISLIARAGCDFMLFDLVDQLANVGLVKTVKTGRTAY